MMRIRAASTANGLQTPRSAIQEMPGKPPTEPTASKFRDQLTSAWHYFNASITCFCSNLLREVQETSIDRTTQLSQANRHVTPMPNGEGGSHHVYCYDG